MDKNFCMSSYLTYRYIEKADMDFFEKTTHRNFMPLPNKKRTPVKTSGEIDKEIEKVFKGLSHEKLGLMLSGGMDSAILAPYMKGADAYTFRYQDNYQNIEVERAEKYAEKYGLNLHYVDMSWDVFKNNTKKVLKNKGAPVHSIEPQIYEAAMQAKKDGVTTMVVGESADLIFGGMDLLLSKDWEYDEFVKRYTFTDPYKVLKNPVDVSYLFKRFIKNNIIDIVDFLNNVFSIESSSSYMNSFETARLKYSDPYAHMIMSEPLDLKRVRQGESKYLIRELFKSKYPEIPVPEKIAMPRQVDRYFKDWKGPTREEFLSNINMEEFDGNQRWQMYCLEEFLNMHS